MKAFQNTRVETTIVAHGLPRFMLQEKLYLGMQNSPPRAKCLVKTTHTHTQHYKMPSVHMCFGDLNQEITLHEDGVKPRVPRPCWMNKLKIEMAEKLDMSLS